MKSVKKLIVIGGVVLIFFLMQTESVAGTVSLCYSIRNAR